MSLTSPIFFAFIAATIMLYHLSTAVAYRRLVLGTANVVFIASYLSNVTQAAPLLALLGLGYIALHAVRARPNATMLGIGITAILLTYIVLKRFAFIEPFVSLPFPYLMIGLSYILFRVIHLIVDARSGGLPDRVGPLAFFRYTCNFLCFVSGPIQRYQEFAATDGVQAAPLDADRVYGAFARIATGYMKFVVIAASADYLLGNFTGQMLGVAEPSVLKLTALYTACSVLYVVYLYFNFSGYMDIVIGIGALLGMTLPENFNHPFRSRSFLEFWQRWHMTLSSWFKLYLFNPLLMLLMARFPNPHATAYLGVVAFFLTFLVMGVWHGTTLVFAIYGLAMGAGASLNKLWQMACTYRLGKKRYRTLTQTILYSYGARGLTFAYFCLALTCLWVPDLAGFTSLIGRLGAVGLGTALLLLTFGFGFVTLIFDVGAGWPALLGTRLRALSDGFMLRNLALAGKILAVLAIASLFNKSPEFVYKAF
jgi:alginate O-acetyltransferase complex protein AlgI